MDFLLYPIKTAITPQNVERERERERERETARLQRQEKLPHKGRN